MIDAFSEFPRAILGVEYLQITNPNLDEEYISSLVDQIEKGELDPAKEQYPYIRVEAYEGYFVIDGNHHVEAYKRAGVKAVESEFYSLSKPFREN